MHYLVVIGDIIKSREQSNRRELQRRFIETLASLNQHSRHIICPYTVTLGDEFQGVLSQGDDLFPALLELLLALEPVKIRFAMGLGTIITDINHSQALAMDGPAFTLAREGIAQLKKSGDLFIINGLPSQDMVLINGALQLVSRQVRKWQPNRLSVLLQLMQGSRVQTIAHQIGMSEQAIYKNISSAGLEAVMQVLAAITSKLNQSLVDHGGKEL